MATAKNGEAMNGKQDYIAAFTLFEATVVLAIMSVFISIVTISINRFNEQLKVTQDVQDELNKWYNFRANLWRECYLADSIRYIAPEMEIYASGKEVRYKIGDESMLFRKGNGTDWLSTGLKADEIREWKEKNQRFVAIDFVWKGTTLEFRYLCKASVKNQVDSWFEQFNTLSNE